jgi:sulfite reductase (NADPH) hemoprotein beta-component
LAIVTLPLTGPDRASGDIDSEQMLRVAQWADEHSFGEIRATQRQSLVLAEVPQGDLPALWLKAKAAGLAGIDAGSLADILACPGADFCSLANARPAPLVREIQAHFGDPGLLARLGPIRVSLSGCMNGCAHHLLADIGLRGIDKKGIEHFQIGVGGRQGTDARFAEILGPAIPADRTPAALERLANAYLAYRRDAEPFAQTVARLGILPFRLALYADAEETREPANA